MQEVVGELLEKIKKAKKSEKIVLLDSLMKVEYTNKEDVVNVLETLIDLLKLSSGELLKKVIKVLLHLKENNVFQILKEETEDFAFSESFLNEEVPEKNGLVISEEKPEFHDFADFLSDFHEEIEGKGEESLNNVEEREEDGTKKDFKERARELREKYPDLMDFEIPEE